MRLYPSFFSMSRARFSVIAALLLLLIQASLIQTTVLPRKFVTARDKDAYISPEQLEALMRGDKIHGEVVFLEDNYKGGPEKASSTEPFLKTQF
jgi:hypothetical protein